mmetsp:Transcript_22639/g.77621  ORF Transcript_22639/g.77621 Transcript_22639/m.77621 type:complete len:301 (+) Transcript_22639:5133-6035(+)
MCSKPRLRTRKRARETMPTGTVGSTMTSPGPRMPAEPSVALAVKGSSSKSQCTISSRGCAPDPTAVRVRYGLLLLKLAAKVVFLRDVWRLGPRPGGATATVAASSTAKESGKRASYSRALAGAKVTRTVVDSPGTRRPDLGKTWNVVAGASRPEVASSSSSSGPPKSSGRPSVQVRSAPWLFVSVMSWLTGAGRAASATTRSPKSTVVADMTMMGREALPATRACGSSLPSPETFGSSSWSTKSCVAGIEGAKTKSKASVAWGEMCIHQCSSRSFVAATRAMDEADESAASSTEFFEDSA